MEDQFLSRIYISTHSPARGLTISAFRYRYVLDISTHSPARGLTKLKNGIGYITIISTHSPARGLTLHPFVAPARDFYFNSQPRKGTYKYGVATVIPHGSFQLTAPQGD